jgi:hypothetical protein
MITIVVLSGHDISFLMTCFDPKKSSRRDVLMSWFIQVVHKHGFNNLT